MHALRLTLFSPHPPLPKDYLASEDDNNDEDVGGVDKETTTEEEEKISAGKATTFISSLRTYAQQQNMPPLVRNQVDALDVAMREHHERQPKSTRPITSFFKPRQE